MSSTTEWERLVQEVRADRRKGKRVNLAYPIEVTGFDRTGRLFCEQTMTHNISDVGCSFRVRTQLQAGDVVAIRVRGRKEESSAENKPLLFKIVWVTRDAEGWTAGAVKLQPDNIWHMAFPPNDRPTPPTD